MSDWEPGERTLDRKETRAESVYGGKGAGRWKGMCVRIIKQYDTHCMATDTRWQKGPALRDGCARQHRNDRKGMTADHA